jgi:hypothetical protein
MKCDAPANGQFYLHFYFQNPYIFSAFLLLLTCDVGYLRNHGEGKR